MSIACSAQLPLLECKEKRVETEMGSGSNKANIEEGEAEGWRGKEK